MKTGEKSKFTHAEIFSYTSDSKISSVQGMPLKTGPNKEIQKVL